MIIEPELIESDKYYTPDIAEFHVGFEYEWLDENGNWVKETSPIEISEDGYEEQTYGVRVKYLDVADIESLGFRQLREDADKDQWFANINNSEYILCLHHEGPTNVWIYDDYIDSSDCTMFKGTIKNKSELKVLLKQLGING